MKRLLRILALATLMPPISATGQSLMADSSTRPLQEAIRSTAALWHSYLSTDSLHAPRALVSMAGYLEDNRKGYLWYQGRRIAEARISATGNLHRPGYGTLYGRATYGRRRVEGRRYNYIDQPEVYRPYLVGDSVQQGLIQESDYRLEGGYSSHWKCWHYGLYLSYLGRAIHRDAPPLLANFSHTFNPNLSIAHRESAHALGLLLSASIQRQIANSHAEVLSTPRFQLFGLGQYNHRESLGGTSYSRAQSLNTAGAKLYYLYEANWRVFASLRYAYSQTQAEESRNISLFGTTSQRGEAAFSAYHPGPVWGLLLTLSAHGDRTLGTEYVFENTQLSAEQNLWDWVQIDDYSFYHREDMALSLTARPSFRINHHHIALGLSWTLGAYREQYDHPRLHTSSTNSSYQIGLGNTYLGKKWCWGIQTDIRLRHNLQNAQDLPSPPSPFFYWIAELPLRFRKERMQTLRAVAFCEYPLGTARIGISLSAQYRLWASRQNLWGEACLYWRLNRPGK